MQHFKFTLQRAHTMPSPTLALQFSHAFISTKQIVVGFCIAAADAIVGEVWVTAATWEKWKFQIIQLLDTNLYSQLEVVRS